MSEQIKKYLDPVKSFWQNLTKKKKIIILSVLGAIILISIIAGVLMNQQPYVVLYPGLDHSEAVEVMNELKNRDVSFKEDNGTIYVPKDKENSLRMDLSNEGHPKTAPNYDFFTKNTSIMSTDYEKKTIEKYQLNQRLESVIKTIDGVENASVTISLPDQSTYAWDDNAAVSTASVTVTLQDGKTLQAKQVNGIKQLVSKSVPNMKSDNVSVVDTATGEELSDTQDTSSNQVDISQFKRTIEKEYENDVEKKILKILTPVFGTNNVQVTAKSVMDVDKKVQEIITYNPTGKTNKGVVTQESTDKEQETGTSSNNGGTTGTQSNSVVPTYPGVTVNGNTIYTKDQQTYQYLVSQVKEQIQGDAASIKDMTVSVVINKAMMDNNQKTQLASLAANAAAIDASKVAVYSAAFATSTTPANVTPSFPNLNQILMYGGIALGMLLLITIVIAVLVAQKRKKKREQLLGAEVEGTVPEDFYELKEGKDEDTEGTEESGEEDESAAEDEGAMEKQPVDTAKAKAEAERLRALKQLEEARAQHASKEEELRQKIQDFSSQNPEIAAQLIRMWLRGDDTDG